MPIVIKVIMTRQMDTKNTEVYDLPWHSTNIIAYYSICDNPGMKSSQVRNVTYESRIGRTTFAFLTLRLQASVGKIV